MALAFARGMSNPKLLIVGGGLAGLSAGCYGRANNFDVTIIEHNLALAACAPPGTGGRT